MDRGDASPSFPWPPVTFGGVATFANASLGRLLLAQSIAVLVTALSVGGLLQTGLSRSIDGAVDRLPERGAIRDGILYWDAPAPQVLAEGSHTAIIVDPDLTGELDPPADVKWVFARYEIRVGSLLGYLALPYPPGWIIELNRPALYPTWRAWKYVLLGMAAMGVSIGVFISWWLLGALYSFPARFLSFYIDRDLNGFRAAKLSAAALLPAALFMNVSAIAYAIHQLSLLQFLAAGIAHLILGWIFLLAAAFRLPAVSAATRKGARSKNPFGSR